MVLDGLSESVSVDDYVIGSSYILTLLFTLKPLVATKNVPNYMLLSGKFVILENLLV